MNSFKVPVAFYSRTRTTRKVAEAISAALESDIEEIFDTKKRTGPLGYINSALDSILKRQTKIKQVTRNPTCAI